VDVIKRAEAAEAELARVRERVLVLEKEIADRDEHFNFGA